MIDPTPRVQVNAPTAQELESRTVGRVIPQKPTINITPPTTAPKSTKVGRFFRRLISGPVGRVLLWTLHIALVVGIVLGLWAINQRYQLEIDLLSPFPWLHPYWLPLLFVLVYAGAWLG
ncbi:MAG: hypothetical protein JWO38_1692, partial [Gemmataceae bacterium]|nr:hypothetical protein [Gemmataceae bacterium]